tara:strand:- start:135 stop:302 length:168 start_codon:yes stop_codon:yes gene_type:complete
LKLRFLCSFEGFSILSAEYGNIGLAFTAQGMQVLFGMIIQISNNMDFVFKKNGAF